MAASRKMIWVTFVFILAIFGHSFSDKPVAVSSSTESATSEIPEVTAAVQKLIDDEKLSGAVVAVVQKDKLIHFKAQGLRDMEHNEPMQTDTLFRIYSMTKPITTVAAMMLWEEGKFKLDDPVYKYIPEFKDLKVYQATKETDSGRAMTVRDLMQHTSGLTYGWGTDAVEKMYGEKNVLDYDQPLSVMIDKLSGIPLLFNPGDKWNYSVSTDVLGYVVQQVSGKPLDVFFQERIFEPLEMNDTAFYVHPDKVDRFAVNYGPDGNGGLKIVDGIKESRFLKNPAMFSGGGGLVSTAPDYVRFCRMLVNKGSLDGQQILKKETVKMMTEHQLPEDMRTTWGTGFGLGFSVLLGTENTEEAIGEYGWSGMASTYFWILPQKNLAVVALSQIIPYSNQLADAIKQPIYDEIGLQKGSLVEAK
ncbi:MAG: serine hydrolase domain-containing protein [Planctomycetota bacterium]|jgi:CubicO group peptidase (beta-lactamase class C family)